VAIDLPEEDNAEDMDFDLPSDETSEDDMAIDLPEEDNAEDMDFDLPSDETSEDDMAFDLPEEDNAEDMDFDLPSDETSEDEKDSDVSLYDEKSGLSKESFMQERLEEELDRSTNDNDNLVLTYIQLAEGSEIGLKELASNLKEEFGNKDLNFQWGDQGISIVRRDTLLEDWLLTLDNLTQKLNGNLRIGVSSRNNRLLDADQLMIEARHAQERASERKPVIGFQADPEKYRMVLSQED
ncbi:MAG: hypothetical protein PF447_15305, partial [Spirochaetaceae bacterium]|jgi:hypothetical protein|nr:hypothetical protein [Spirochaetaceae bacterium]